MAGGVFTCRRCGITGGAQVVHELVRTATIKPYVNSIGFQLVDRDDTEVESVRYFECRLCNATEDELETLFDATGGTT